MKVVFAGIVAAIVLGFAAGAILGTEQRAAYEVFATGGTRVGTPEQNLVGDDWSGLNTPAHDGPGHKAP
jgi:hypothetical protein